MSPFNELGAKPVVRSTGVLGPVKVVFECDLAAQSHGFELGATRSNARTSSAEPRNRRC